MPQYRYQAYRPDGSIDRDTITAGSEQAAYQLLSRSGKIPFDLKQASNDNRSDKKQRSIGFGLLRQAPDDARFFSELAILLQSGFTLNQAIAAMQADTDNVAEADRLATILQRLQEGGSVAEAFQLEGIPDDVIALIAAGENSGSLPKVMTAIAGRFDLAAKRRSDVQEALLYPAFLIVMLIGAILILAFYLVPAIEPIFDGRPEGKPFIVAMLSGIRDMLSRYGLWIISAALLVAGLAVLSEPLRQRLSASIDHLPFVGAFRRQNALANYLSALHLLLSNGVPMKESLHLATDAIPGGLLKSEFAQAEEAVASGSRLHAALEQTGRFSHALIAHIRIGEESNNLSTMLERGAASLIHRQKLRIDRLMKFLTPAITIGIGLMIGGLVTAVMGTLLSVNELAVQ